METHYFLVAHGSRDLRSQQSFQQLTALFTQAAAHRGIKPEQIHSGTLELGLPLEERLQQLGQSLAEPATVEILPLFLLPGTHVMSDIPEAIAVAQQQVPQVHFNLRPHLGSHPGILELLRARISTRHPWILVAHGSRYPGGNAVVEELATALDVKPAYWSVEPSLEDSLRPIVEQGHRNVGVLPYFLFSGKITDAIAEQINQLKYRFGQLNLALSSPLDPSPALAQLLIDLT
ncbi:Sirohydrochlorin cobaltochelatase [Acaryochloris thomasi RCC1774]|uniref:Sirohydrochlorin cobaltochelatase n=1 Tax=Acaryochloris thomasi RCC1774 TaxID=1764569 RepID=A0A2W1JSE3_9CYAN|nr:sirohydrochlorin chelatase [Acaryochloris thomasi]PZD71667.1 Sirohydrochlorin cobaltochelatase [Acaryochloris thomasi RCC1774]